MDDARLVVGGLPALHKLVLEIVRDNGPITSRMINKVLSEEEYALTPEYVATNIMLGLQQMHMVTATPHYTGYRWQITEFGKEELEKEQC